MSRLADGGLPHLFAGGSVDGDEASDDDEFFERRVIPFRDAVAMALDDRITESVSKVALLAPAPACSRPLRARQ